MAGVALNRSQQQSASSLWRSACACAKPPVATTQQWLRAFRAVALDLDGTTLNDAGELSTRTASTLRRVHDGGIHVIIATGRPTNALQPIVDALQLRGKATTCVNFNGAVAQYLPCTSSAPSQSSGGGGKLVFSTPLDHSTATAVLDVCEALGTCVSYPHIFFLCAPPPRISATAVAILLKHSVVVQFQ